MIVPTPIGNMEDITLRALRALRQADIVACEDTRRTRKILERFNIKAKLVSYHEHNERQRTQWLLGILREGKVVALVSDAGTPGISDPGAVVIKEAIKEGIKIEALPGPTALIPALLLSGFPLEFFSFFGFLPRKRKERKAYFERITKAPPPVALYVSPHRIKTDISDLLEALGPVEGAVIRECTKVHEEVVRGPLNVLLEWAEENEPRGEMVLVLYPSCHEEDKERQVDGNGWLCKAKELIDKGEKVKDVAKRIQEEYGIPKNKVKKELLHMNTEERR
ncbi:Uroporphyrin-III C/tetrapyrrole (Corrin/Porphyrin) methyltransferase [Thermovirga lienii DSM 17291]|uniref:Ribosomal RNA small subunit methyltransferase I n=1 Tax=Thermovirga lienii (strain ATCC BAA-1197 / DSM 17291 / Cas60314) TaxID=580340 RepID=G7V8S7_THELD|nr:Uroporphyrin-III C/tetrapyrrole (Corrin/Porphyrin) methyltransferase [Thermovirga lienii DSM 17291]MDN5318573.1 rRNA (cytidine1402-2-O)-methyltransferase [Thermovirga sp.]MDN5367568.1 rRNA (cytidine1402-2-O)-methyltransferase [Thermovirga sp.]